jgi:anaerobic magnesium-protoporphyrin IX monomethyl ester cyclase
MIVVIASSQPLDVDAHIRQRMMNAEKAAENRSSRYPGLDLLLMQQQVNKNLQKLFLQLDGRYMPLFDLMNYLANGRQIPRLDPENVSRYYSLANMVTLNGIYLYQFLLDAGYDPVLVQNYAITDLNEILLEKPFAVCISSNFLFMEDIRKIGLQVKQHAPETHVIAGGMLVKRLLDPGNHLPPQALTYWSTFSGKVDAFVIEAQGERSLMELLRCLEHGPDMSRVSNLAYFDEQGNIVFTPRQKEEQAIDQTRIAWDRIPGEYLRKTLPVNTSRGCAFRCRFCNYHWFFPKVQYRSLDVLRGELQRIQDLGFVKHVRFSDDNFTSNKARLRAVLEMMIESRFDFTWSAYARASALTPELVALMKASGCEFIDMGIESGSQMMLNNMDKRLDRDQALDAIGMLKAQGIQSRGTFIIGYPGETEETFRETSDFINESGLTYYHPYLFSYSKRTLVHQERERYGLEGSGLTWRHNTMDSVEASSLMTRMLGLIPDTYTDGQAHIMEIFKTLRGEGYSSHQIVELFRLKRDLQLTIKGNGGSGPFPPGVEAILSDLEAVIH